MGSAVYFAAQAHCGSQPLHQGCLLLSVLPFRHIVVVDSETRAASLYTNLLIAAWFAVQTHCDRGP